MLKIKSNGADFHRQHVTHRETLLKFVFLLFIFVAYFLYMSWKYGVSAGLGVSVLTWSFFVLCTPVADAGFILAFPIRLLFKIKMLITQAALWLIAIGINMLMLTITPETYNLTFLTKLLERILSEPYPYWSILVISALGTFLSIYFGDEMMDVTTHKNRELSHRHGFKYRTILVLGLGVLAVAAYYYLLNNLNIVLPE
ncbi:MAG: hypothetical protein ACC707_20540 [Thiohalomonadales bacterium]